MGTKVEVWLIGHSWVFMIEEDGRNGKHGRQLCLCEAVKGGCRQKRHHL